MTKNKATLAEALTLLEKEELNGDYEIEYIDADKVASTDAIKIGALVQRRLCLRSCVCKTRFCEIGYIRYTDWLQPCSV